jgi:hypothetical protein
MRWRLSGKRIYPSYSLVKRRSIPTLY